MIFMTIFWIFLFISLVCQIKQFTNKNLPDGLIILTYFLVGSELYRGCLELGIKWPLERSNSWDYQLKLTSNSDTRTKCQSSIDVKVYLWSFWARIRNVQGCVVKDWMTKSQLQNIYAGCFLFLWTAVSQSYDQSRPDLYFVVLYHKI